MTTDVPAGMERMSGNDAALLHMEDACTPMHTLKIVIIDPARRGRPVALDELSLAVGSRLGLVPRSTQKVVTVPGFGARPFWVDDPEFDLSLHLAERTLPTGSASELDGLFGELASRPLPRDRALWSMTLVHGLERGRQAVVVAVHHAVVDGLGALNTMLAATTDQPGRSIGLAPAVTPEPVSTWRLARTAVADAARTPRRIRDLVRDAREAPRSAANPDIPSGVLRGRSSLNAFGDSTRVCASGSLDLGTMKRIGKAAGVTVNGVLHAVIAGALRAELAERGEDTSIPCRAAFGIASDTGDRNRLQGNFVTPTFVHLRSDLDDPRERLSATARSCTAAVEARRRAGLDLTDAVTGVAPRLLNGSRRLAATRTSANMAHVVTANCPGPQRTRWLGDVEVVDWFSFAVAVAPVGVNITVHSYDGRMNVGIIADPRASAEPHRLVERLERELDDLAGAVTPADPTTPRSGELTAA